jgi:hypothetical protein
LFLVRGQPLPWLDLDDTTASLRWPLIRRFRSGNPLAYRKISECQP